MLWTGTDSGRRNALAERSDPIVTLSPKKALDKSVALLELLQQSVRAVLRTNRIMRGGMVRDNPAAVMKLPETLGRIEYSEGILLYGTAGGFGIQGVYDGQYVVPESIYRKFAYQLRVRVPVLAQPGSQMSSCIDG